MKTALERMFRGRKMDTTKVVEKPHVIALPLGSQGHMAPLLRVSKNLARHGVAITFVCFDIQVSGLMAADAELQNLDVKFFGVPRPYEIPRSAGGAAAAVEKGFQPLREKLVCQHAAGALGPTFIIADMFNTWSEGVASQLQIPWYVFIPSGAIVARLFQATENLLLKISKIISGAAGILVNSFYELESAAVDALRRYACTLPTGLPQKIYAIGPLVPEAILRTSSVPPGLHRSEEHCLRWLDTQPKSSVLYICFGTLFQRDSRQLNKLASVLESCNQRFLWVIREPVLGRISSTALPPGFEARIGERGCFVRGWAPQIEVLSHTSTGGFLTHCGWNSSMEAVSSGVPMIGWPIGAEQYMNCRLLVDVLQVATEIRGEEDGFEQQNEIRRAVQLVMVDGGGKVMKSRVKALQAKAIAAVGVNGSSSRSLEELAKDLAGR